MGFIEIFHDRKRLEQHRFLAIDQGGDQHLRVDRAKRILALLSRHEIDVHDLVGRKTLEVERNAHAEGRERTPERKQLHALPCSKL